MNQSVKHDRLFIRGGKEFRLGSGISEVEQKQLLASLCRFLSANKLAAVTLPESESHDWEHFELRESHVTELGRRVLVEGLHRWLQNLDRGGRPDRTVALSRALARLSSNKLLH